MARQPRDIRLQTREARARLPAQKEPYWHELRRGLALGYYRGSHKGAWWVREYREGRLWKRRIAAADDELDADGSAVLSWPQALKIAIGEERPTATAAAPYTVADALEDYWRHRQAKSPPGSVRTDQAKAQATILPKLGGEDVNALTPAALREWRDGLVRGSEEREEMRRQQATANRAWAILRAALNHAYDNGKARSADAWRRIRPFRNVDRPRLRALGVAEIKRLMNALDPEFRPLARGAIHTGLRLGELLRLRAADVEPKKVHVRISKSGRSRSVPLNAEGAKFFEESTAGLAGDALVFTRADGREWNRMDVSRRMAAASEAGKVAPPATFHDLRRSYATLLINRGTDAEVIRELLGHADLRMTTRAYAHILNRTVAKAVRKMPRLQLGRSNVRKLQP